MVCLAALQVALQVQGVLETSSIHSDYTGYRAERTRHKCIYVELTEKHEFTESTDDAESNLSPDIQTGLSLFICMSMCAYK